MMERRKHCYGVFVALGHEALVLGSDKGLRYGMVKKKAEKRLCPCSRLMMKIFKFILSSLCDGGGFEEYIQDTKH